MPYFKDREMMEEMFGELWNRVIHEFGLGKKLKEAGITILYRVSDPDMVMYVDENGPLFGDAAEAKSPVITNAMHSDIVHRFWLKKLNVPKAMALRQIKAKGPVTKGLKLMPLLKPAQDIYPEYCKKYGLPTEI